MKRAYMRWSAVAGALISGGLGTYQGVQYVMTPAPATEVAAQDPAQPDLAEMPRPIPNVDPTMPNAPANGVTTTGFNDATVVRGNDDSPAGLTPIPPDGSYSPASSFPGGGTPGPAPMPSEPYAPAPITPEGGGLGAPPVNALRGGNLSEPTGIAPVESPSVAPINSAPVEPAPINSAPIGSAPIEPAPIQSAPIEPAPIRPASPAPVASEYNQSAPVGNPGQGNPGQGNATAGNFGGNPNYAPDPAPVGTNPVPGYDSPQASTSNQNYPTNNGYNDTPNSVGQGYDLPSQPADQSPIRTAAGAAGQGVPGERKLEGPQAPQIVIEKKAPSEIQVNIPATFEIYVRNVGTVDALNVTVTDEIPKTTQLVEASPNPMVNGGTIQWDLNTMKPGDERVLTMKVLPTGEGEVGSVARVAFQTSASARTVCTKPVLKIEHTSNARVLMGEYVNFSITLSNTGTGPAYDVILEDDVPQGLSHEQGSALRHQIGTLPAGATRTLELTLQAASPGHVKNVLRAMAKGDVVVEDSFELEVVAPELKLSLNGPKQRYLNRKATYSFAVFNPGTAPANEVELVSYLPKGFEFVEADNQGHYDPRKHAVYWSLTQLPPEQKGQVNLTVVPVETGEQKFRAEGRAQRGLSAAGEHLVMVNALPELRLNIADSADPIEVGKETTYEIRVSNTGSKDGTNVQLAALLPNGLKAVGADGPTREQIDGQQIMFEPLSRLATNDSVVYRIQAQGVTAGDQQIQVQVICDDSQTPTLYQEVTRVYADR